jgi:hypothetical protein
VIIIFINIWVRDRESSETTVLVYGLTDDKGAETRVFYSFK